ncbi:unknown [Prevotella sp. CAG:5226]|nr:unknown [Prevotella sp. CAG:5226]
MKHFLCRHTFICMCDVFVRYMYFFVLCLIPKVLHRSIMALSWTRVGGVTIFLARQISAKFLLLPRWT